MENINEGTPVTSGSQTPPVPVGGGWGPMPGYYNMYPWQGMMPGMAAGGSMPGMVAGGSMPAWQGVPGMQPGMQMMPGWAPGMQMMPGGTDDAAPDAGDDGGGTGDAGDAGGENVYRPSFDFSTASSHTSTPSEAQFTQFESFSLEELGFDILGVPETPVQTGGAGRGRGAPKKKGKGKRVGESSQPGEDVSPVRRRWTDAENVALAKAWVSVCDDPLTSNNQRIVNLWGKIAAAYKTFCPEGRPRNGEDCRKAWDRIRAAVSRFSGLYTNALRMQSSGQTEDDCRRIAEKAFPQPGLYKDFTYWNCYVVLNDSEKFRAGVDAGWPKKQRLNYSGDYSGSSGGSHNLPEGAQELPSPHSFARRTRPVGQRRAQREARGVAGRSQEVQSAPPLRQSTEDLKFFARQQTRAQMVNILADWKAAEDPEEKSFLHALLVSMRDDLNATAARGVPPATKATATGPVATEVTETRSEAEVFN